MSFLILGYVVTFIDAALLLYFVSISLKNMKAGWKSIVFSLLLITIINSSAGAVFGDGTALASIVMIASTGIIYKLIFNEKLFNIFLVFLMGILLMFVSEAIAILSILPFGIEPNHIHNNFNALLIAGFISKTTFFILVKFLLPRIKFARKINKMISYQLMQICIFNTIIIFMSFWFYRHTDMPLIRDNKNLYIVLTTLGAMIFSIGILSITRGIIKQSQREADWKIKENEYKRQMFYIDNIKNMLNSINAQRHDFNNHISCLYGLIKLNKSSEALGYIESLVDDITKFNYILDIENPFLSALVNAKLTLAQQEKIYMEADINIPVDISIEAVDLSIILGNLLDNSIEACKLDDIDYKYIELYADINNNDLVISLINSKSSKIEINLSMGKDRVTSKSDKDNHGFGLKNIRETVRKYGGTTEIEDREDHFVVNIKIPLEAKSDKEIQIIA
jgi:hypothetical protein